MEKHYLQDMIEPVVETQGYELVRVLMTGGTSQTLQIMIENKDHKTPITVDDCAKVSRALSDILDEKDPISDKYNLEVSSTGVDRPLTKIEHYSRFAGYEVKVETAVLTDGRKRFKGKIVGVDGNNISIAEDDKTFLVDFDNITKAKLVLTDELWEEYCRQNTQDKNEIEL